MPLLCLWIDAGAPAQGGASRAQREGGGHGNNAPPLGPENRFGRFGCAEFMDSPQKEYEKSTGFGGFNPVANYKSTTRLLKSQQGEEHIG